MEMFLMVVCVSLFGLALSVLAFGAATRAEPADRETVVEPRLELAPPQFFVGPLNGTRPSPPVPVEVLLLQIERHVRVEQAAAESFTGLPTVESLHQRTSSPFYN